MANRVIKLPDIPKNWGPFLAFTAGITLSAFGFASMARTEIGAVIVGGLAATALVVGLVARLKNV